MASKAVLILIDGMRPDGVQRCGEAFPKELVREGSACFQGRTVMPSITLPCHASLFFSVDPERHGILTNEWRPMARPIDSLGDVTARYFKRAAMFYNWEAPAGFKPAGEPLLQPFSDPGPALGKDFGK